MKGGKSFFVFKNWRAWKDTRRETEVERRDRETDGKERDRCKGETDPRKTSLKDLGAESG